MTKTWWRKARGGSGRRISVAKLHVGCGTAIIPGWFNTDLQQLPGVDLALDVTREFPFVDVRYIFCEHFLEHLPFDAGVRFLEDCFDALEVGGVLRLSTPSLDWVYLSHYIADDPDRPRKLNNTFMLNRAFYAWGHRFLYSPELLTELVMALGFAPVTPCRHGESAVPELDGLEHHPLYDASAGIPEIIILEATKPTRSTAEPEALENLMALAREQFLGMLDWRLDR